MNSKERVLTAIQGGEVDKVPFDLGSSRVTGITKSAFEKLIDALNEMGLSDEVENFGGQLFDAKQQLVDLDNDLCHLLKIDVRGIMPNLERKNPRLEEDNQNFSYTDEWGITYKKPKGSGEYYSRVNGPLPEEPTIGSLEDINWPDPEARNLFSGLKDQASKFNNDEYAVIMEGLGAGIYETASRMRGAEHFYQDLVRRPEFARSLLEKVFQIKRAFWKKAGKMLGSKVQIVREGDDLAGQENMLISPGIYRDMIKPLHDELFSEIKNSFPDPIYVFFHSDGAMKEILPDLVECGIDILNPIQVSAKNISIEELGSKYGKDLTLWGGGIDTQTELPFESPEKIKSIVGERLKEGRDYKFVFSAVHNIQGDTPAENIQAMFETLWAER